MDVRFLPNLRPGTVSPEFRRRVRPAGYLAPPNALTSSTRVFAAMRPPASDVLVLDNGLFDDIGRISSALAGEMRPVTSRLQATQNRLGHPLRPGDVGASDRAEVAELARRAKVMADAVVARADEPLIGEIHPTALIGPEDATLAAWLRLGIDHPHLAIDRRSLRRANRAVARRVADWGVRPGVAVMAVASALDYDTAFDAGQEFAEAGLASAAMGFGAYMADRTSRDTMKVKGKWRRLDASSPQRYLRTAAVARGFFDGWQSRSNTPPAWFHFLGLGLPIMVGIAALAAYPTARITFDATSPIKDVYEGALYTSRPSYLKISTVGAARRLASDPRQRWRCPCRFCGAFVEEYPFDYDGGAAWWSSTGPGSVRPSDLLPSGPLYGLYPLLAHPSGGPRGRAVDVARTGHNHWALEQITRELRIQATSLARLAHHLEFIVDAYEASAASTELARTVQLSLRIASGRWP